MLNVMKSANLGLAFILELCALAALGYWGFQGGDSTLIKIILGIGAPLLMIVIWGKYLAPRSATRLQEPLLSLVKLVVFGAAALALASTGQSTLALVFGAVVIVNVVLAYIWKQAYAAASS